MRRKSWFRPSAVIALCAGVLATPAARAQRVNAPAEMDRRWLPWLGCWQGDSSSSLIVCLVPASGTRGVERVTIDGRAIVSRDRIIADSVTRRFTREGCRGIETAEWSSTGHQVFLRAEFTCNDSLEGRSTTLFAFSPSGEWIESSQLRAARGSLVRATRYRDAGVPSALPGEVATALRARQLAIATARTAALSPITTEEVNNVTLSVGEAAASPWLSLRGYAMQAPAPAPAPAQMQAPAAPSGQEVCQTVVCYSPRSYSTYNEPPPPPQYPEYPYGPYAYPPNAYGYMPTIGYPGFGYGSSWFPGPLVVIGSGKDHRGVRGGFPRDGRFTGQRPTVGLRPGVHQPAPRPSVQQPATRASYPRRR
jgi:hypothetical protein